MANETEYIFACDNCGMTYEVEPIKMIEQKCTHPKETLLLLKAGTGKNVCYIAITGCQHPICPTEGCGTINLEDVL